MADEKKSIFDFADKFGYKSPFGNWEQEDFKTNQKEVSITDLIISKDEGKNNKLVTEEQFLKILTKKEPTVVYTAISVTVLTDGYCDKAVISIKGVGSIERPVIHRSNGIYEAIAKFILPIPKSLVLINGFNSVGFIVNAEIIQKGHTVDKKEGKIQVDTYRNISNDDDKTNNKNCGIEYRNKVKCTRYNGVYGPVYWGTLELKKYPNWEQLVKDHYITNDERDILIGMSKNEGKIDGVQSYDSEVVTVGAMQKTLKDNGQGQFYTQVLEFRNQNKVLYEDLFEKCGWKIENNKLTYNGMSGQALKDLIRKGFNKDVYGLSTPSIPLEPLIKACHNSEFQKKQILDFIDALSTIVGFYPVGYSYKIEEYFQSNFSKAVILDQYVNRPNYVKTDLGSAMDRFFAKHPSYSKSPDDWGNNQYDYELEIMEDYGKNRRGTDMVNRYNNLKEYFLK